MATFQSILQDCSAKNDSLLCVGLDPDITKLPEGAKDDPQPLFAFNKAIIDATADLVCAFKPNSAFYEAHGAEGIGQLKQTVDYIKTQYPHVPVLLDFKRGDIGNTNSHYAHFAFEYLGADAITIQPYLGREANEVFLSYREKGIFVLCRTSNPGSGEFQDIAAGGKKLYQTVAEHVTKQWNEHGNCHLVLGAPYPEELARARQTAEHDIWFLVPGTGTQGGDLASAIQSGQNQAGGGVIINASREVLYASAGNDFSEAARKKAMYLRDDINQYRRRDNGRP